VGHFDLTCSLGIPGEFENPKFKDAVARVLEACDKHGKAAGRLVPDAASGIALNRDGFDFICYSGDVWALQAAIKSGVDEIRAGCAAKAPASA
jgi:2-keto-3-deoxy-L-rhamnonate aldolase RhmA